MSAHADPSAAQRCHWYVKSSAGEPDQTPRWAVSVLPTAAPPVICGGARFAGGAASTGAVGAEKVPVDPPAPVRKTRARSVTPTSAAPSMKVRDVALGTSVQLAPSVSQRHHSYVVSKTTGPIHVPSTAVSSSPSRGGPLTVGATTLTGGFGPTPPVSGEDCELEPAPFVAVMTRRSAKPTSEVESM